MPAAAVDVSLEKVLSSGVEVKAMGGSRTGPGAEDLIEGLRENAPGGAHVDVDAVVAMEIAANTETPPLPLFAPAPAGSSGSPGHS